MVQSGAIEPRHVGSRNAVAPSAAASAEKTDEQRPGSGVGATAGVVGTGATVVGTGVEVVWTGIAIAGAGAGVVRAGVVGTGAEVAGTGTGAGDVGTGAGVAVGRDVAGGAISSQRMKCLDWIVSRTLQKRQRSWKHPRPPPRHPSSVTMLTPN